MYGAIRRTVGSVHAVGVLVVALIALVSCSGSETLGSESAAAESPTAVAKPTALACVDTDTGAFTLFDPPGSVTTLARAMNSSGEIAGFFTDEIGESHGFVRSDSGAFTTIDVPGAASTVAYLLSDSGTVIGHFALPGEQGQRGFIWTPPGSCPAR